MGSTRYLFSSSTNKKRKHYEKENKEIEKSTAKRGSVKGTMKQS